MLAVVVVVVVVAKPVVCGFETLQRNEKRKVNIRCLPPLLQWTFRSVQAFAPYISQVSYCLCSKNKVYAQF